MIDFINTNSSTNYWRIVKVSVVDSDPVINFISENGTP